MEAVSRLVEAVSRLVEAVEAVGRLVEARRVAIVNKHQDPHRVSVVGVSTFMYSVE